MSRVIAIVQARVASHRLPGKVLRPLNGEPALAHVLRRTARCSSVEDVILATSTRPENDELALHAARLGFGCYRGSEEDVLSRFVDVARAEKAGVVVRVCADNFALDGGVIEKAIDKLRAESLDVCSPFLDDYSYPFGAGAEVSTAEALFRLDANTLGLPASYREHVFSYAYEHRDRYRVAALAAPPEHARPDVRISVDTQEDWKRLETVYRRLAPRGNDFSLSELIGAWDAIDSEASTKESSV